jgi:diaminohydroxyphosphoribosylaminopyrimidine deaminase/5-amino-6-(5-phosphoribosylamino)uracil reductase
VIVDSALRTPPAARMLDAPGSALIYTAQDLPQARAPLQARAAEIVLRPGEGGRVDLAAVLQDLGERGINELHVEAGQVLNGAFVQAGLVDEYLVYIAPLLIGPGRDLAGFGPLQQLSQAQRLRFVEVTQVGADLRVLARRLD